MRVNSGKQKYQELEKKKDKIIDEDYIENDDILNTQNMIDDAVARRNEKVKLFTCDICNFQSGSKTLLHRHMQSRHEKNKYECDECDYKATTKDGLRKHQNESHKHFKYQCNQCEYKDDTESNINTHIKSFHKPQKLDDQKKSKYVTKRI